MDASFSDAAKIKAMSQRKFTEKLMLVEHFVSPIVLEYFKWECNSLFQGMNITVQILGEVW